MKIEFRDIEANDSTRRAHGRRGTVFATRRPVPTGRRPLRVQDGRSSCHRDTFDLWAGEPRSAGFVCSLGCPAFFAMCSLASGEKMSRRLTHEAKGPVKHHPLKYPQRFEETGETVRWPKPLRGGPLRGSRLARGHTSRLEMVGSKWHQPWYRALHGGARRVVLAGTAAVSCGCRGLRAPCWRDVLPAEPHDRGDRKRALLSLTRYRGGSLPR